MSRRSLADIEVGDVVVTYGDVIEAVVVRLKRGGVIGNTESRTYDIPLSVIERTYKASSPVAKALRRRMAAAEQVPYAQRPLARKASLKDPGQFLLPVASSTGWGFEQVPLTETLNRFLDTRTFRSAFSERARQLGLNLPPVRPGDAVLAVNKRLSRVAGMSFFPYRGYRPTITLAGPERFDSGAEVRQTLYHEAAHFVPTSEGAVGGASADVHPRWFYDRILAPAIKELEGIDVTGALRFYTPHKQGFYRVDQEMVQIMKVTRPPTARQQLAAPRPAAPRPAASAARAAAGTLSLGPPASSHRTWSKIQPGVYRAGPLTLRKVEGGGWQVEHARTKARSRIYKTAKAAKQAAEGWLRRPTDL